jgi:hypothetical protein
MLISAASTRRRLLFAAFAAAVLSAGVGPGDKKSNPNAPFGLPGPASIEPGDRDHYLIERPE